MKSRKQVLRTALAALGLLHSIQMLRTSIQMLRTYIRQGSAGLSQRRLNEAKPRRAAEFVRRYAPMFGSVQTKPPPDAKSILVIVGSANGRIEVQLGLVKALELTGWRSISLLVEGANFEGLDAYYHLLSSTTVRRWSDYIKPAAFHGYAEKVVHNARSLKDLLEFRVGAVRVGGHAVSTTRRKLSGGILDLNDEAIQARLIKNFALSLASRAAAEQFVREFRPSLVLTDDTAYTPRGEILDTCVEAGIPVIRWSAAHKANALMLKRYTSANRDHDINSLSNASWRLVQEMDWSVGRGERLKRELTIGYARKDWYNEDGAQFNKRLLGVDGVRKKLGLDPKRKTAIIFPHVAYDASFGRGEDLFASYDEWLIETVRAACANEELQWIIRVHPNHPGKVAQSGRRAYDERLLRKLFGRLPKHFSVIPAYGDISTLSLFPIMDYCLTVRGTVGIEAACRGIPVLTGGAGRYDRKGFTIDSETPIQYLEWIARLHDIPRLSPTQIELAERFAYGLFLLRPLPLTSIATTYDKKFAFENLANPVQINLRNRKDWEEASDLQAFADWVTKSDTEDFLLQLNPDTVDGLEDVR